jgi:response regulator NasT
MLQQAGLAPMRVCIFSPVEELCESLALEIQDAGYRVEEKFTEPEALTEFIARSNIDHIVLIDARRDRENSLKLIRELCVGPALAIVALITGNNSRPGTRDMEVGAQTLLVEPATKQDLCAAFTAAVYQQAKQARMEAEIDRLRDKLAERKLIEKAKGILMDAAKVTEAEAFRMIQKQSQNKRKPMSEIATLIISATQMVREAAQARAD